MSSSAEAYYQQIEEQIKKLKKEIAEGSSKSQKSEQKSGGKEMLVGAAGLGAAGLATKGFSAAPSLTNLSSGAKELASGAGSFLGIGSSAPGLLLSDGSIIAQGAAIPEGLFAVGSAPIAQSALGTIGGVAAGALGAYQAYQLGKRLSDESRQGSPARSIGEGAMAGAGIGTAIAPGIGTAIGAGVGALGGLAGKLTASGKSKDQMKRDMVRKQLREMGALDEQWSIGLADGSRFDYGKDGGARLANYDGKGERSYKDVDFNNPFANRAVAMTNPLGYLMGGKDTKLSTEMVGYHTNAVTSNAKDEKQVEENARSLYNQFGFKTREDAIAGLDQLKADGAINEDLYAAFTSEVSRLLPSGAEAPKPEPSQGGVDYEIPEEKPMSKKRLNSRFSTGFTANPTSKGSSTGVNSYLAMLETMGRG
jgi:hypothetical protein